MQLEFASEGLRELCEQEKAARKLHGADAAKKLRRRLDDLTAASRLGEVVAGKPHALKYDRKGQYAISLAGGLRLILEPGGNDVPLDADGEIDWPNVPCVTITEVANYHD